MIPETVESGIREVTRALAIPRGQDPDEAERTAAQRRRVRAVACPWCKARPREACTIPNVVDEHGKAQQLAAVGHPSRIEAAA